MLRFREWAEWTGPSGFDAVCLFCDCSSSDTDEILAHMTVSFILVLPVLFTSILLFVVMVNGSKLVLSSDPRCFVAVHSRI